MPRLLAPRLWGAHLLVVLAVVAAALLGLWQLDVWRDHRADAASSRVHESPVALSEVYGHDDPFPAAGVGQPVDLDGSWVSSATVFVSGHAQGGRDGYWMVTPLAIGGGDRPALPVVLGWVPDPASAPAPPSGSARLVAWLQPSDDGSDATATTQTSSSRNVLGSLRTADLVQRVHQDLYDGYAVARGGVDGLPQADLPRLPGVGRFTSVRNLLYGIQWWVFGAFAVLIWWRWVEEQTSEPADEDDREPSTVNT